MASIFQLSTLLIWLPGAAFLISAVYVVYCARRNSDSRIKYYVSLALLVLSLLLIIIVPGNEINEAIEFANLTKTAEEPEITQYVDIPYNLKDQYWETALPVEQRQSQQSSNADIFDFGAAAGNGGDAEASEMDVVDDERLEGLEYDPENQVAWSLLLVLTILGVLYYIHGSRVFKK